MLKSFVVMKAVEMIHGKRGRTSLYKVLKGSRAFGVEKMVNEFDMMDIWGVFFKLPQEQLEDQLTELMDQGLIYTEEVQSGHFAYPMLFISEEGRALLSTLEATEKDKLNQYREELWNATRHYEISEKGRVLEEFVSLLMVFLFQPLCNEQVNMDMDILIKTGSISVPQQEMLEKFIYHITPDKYKEQWRVPYTLEGTCKVLMTQLRDYLSGLPEIEAQIFRWHFGVTDAMTNSREEIIKYYGLPENSVPALCKRIVSRFSNRGLRDRYSFVENIMSFIEEFMGESGENTEHLVKETAMVTYELYQQGLPLAEIARERGLSLSTIYSHFSKLIPIHRIDINTVISSERLEKILQMIEDDGSENVKLIKKRLPSDYTYGEINLVLELQKGYQVVA